jgi:hypothetical protein
MTVLSKKTTWLTLCLAAMMCMQLACVGQQKTPPSNPCTLPSGHLVDAAFQTARSTLSQPDCRYQFDAVFAALLQVCEGSPDMAHKEAFSDFLVWSKDQGIISTIQAQERYNRYFTARYVSMPDDYNTCSYCPQLRSILSACHDELRDKQTGLLRVCGDKATHAKASSDLQKLELILEATCAACATE